MFRPIASTPLLFALASTAACGSINSDSEIKCVPGTAGDTSCSINLGSDYVCGPASVCVRDTSLVADAGSDDKPKPDATEGSCTDNCPTKLDVLFVIDNSSSMREEQELLATNFDRFIDGIADESGVLPDLHLGVVTTDVGAGPYGIDKCTGLGDNGALQTNPAGACEAPGPEPYIIDGVDKDGARIRNYVGSLADAYACIGRPGTRGCGFEQPLESMYHALDNASGENEGFLRKDAALAVVLIGDEDDCSARDFGIFSTDSALDRGDSELGYLSSFRCFEFGVICNPDEPRVPGAKNDCQVRQDSRYLYSIDRYSDFLKGLKDDPSQIVVAAITGGAGPVTVQVSEDGKHALQPACTGAHGSADPALRLTTFLADFPERNVNAAICADNLNGALTEISAMIRTVLGQ